MARPAANMVFTLLPIARLHNIEQQLLNMFGKRDEMLRFTRAVSGSYFFTPSLKKLLAL